MCANLWNYQNILIIISSFSTLIAINYQLNDKNDSILKIHRVTTRTFIQLRINGRRQVKNFKCS